MDERIPLHVVVYGDPGSGKTTFAAMFPQPIEVWHFDAPGKDVPYHRAGGDIRLLHFNDFDPKGETWRRFDQHSLATREAVMAGRSDLQTVVVDSVTFMELAARKYDQFVINKASREPRKWFAASTDALESVLMLRLMALPINVVVICHIDQERDEVNGAMLLNPAAPGRMKRRLPAAYAEFYRAYAGRDDQGNRYYALQTASDGKYNASTQINAPDPCWNEYEALWNGAPTAS